MSDEAPPTKILDATEVAARQFVYKLYDTADGQPMQWIVLHGMGESAATISRAVERGWVILQGESRRPLERKVALTDEGRRLARKARSAVTRDQGLRGKSKPLTTLVRRRNQRA